MSGSVLLKEAADKGQVSGLVLFVPSKCIDTWSSASGDHTNRFTALAAFSQTSDSPHPTLPGLAIADWLGPTSSQASAGASDPVDIII